MSLSSIYLSSKITPSEIQDKTINIISFCKTKGHNPGFLYSHSHYSVIQMTSPMSLLSVLLFWPQTDPHWFRTESQRSDWSRSRERRGRKEETFKQQKQGYLNYLAGSQPSLYIRSIWGSLKSYESPWAHPEPKKPESQAGGSHLNFFKAPSNDCETQWFQRTGVGPEGGV